MQKRLDTDKENVYIGEKTFNPYTMAQYAIAFDLDTKAMREAGFTDSQVATVYQREIPTALAQAGFTAHPQGSLYHTVADQDQIVAIMKLQNVIKQGAPNFCRFVKNVHVFRMEEWSDVTPILSTRPEAVAVPVDPEIEVEQAEILNDIKFEEEKRGAA